MISKCTLSLNGMISKAIVLVGLTYFVNCSFRRMILLSKKKKVIELFDNLFVSLSRSDNLKLMHCGTLKVF